MATSPPPEQILALSQAYRLAANRRAAAIAALVSLYYRSKVDIANPASIDAWLKIMIPRILREHDNVGNLAATYGNTIRRLELPDVNDGFLFDKAAGAVAEQVEKSLLVVGPTSLQGKLAKIRELDIDPHEKTVLIDDAEKSTVTQIAGAVARHVQNGGRQTILDGTKADHLALGYVRVTKDSPCYFCAMLASRGLVFAEDSFDASDPRFTGEGTAKVHDHCACSMKPVYTRKGDPLLDRAKEFEALWQQYSTGSSGDAIRSFRSGYNAHLRESANEVA